MIPPSSLICCDDPGDEVGDRARVGRCQRKLARELIRGEVHSRAIKVENVDLPDKGRPRGGLLDLHGRVELAAVIESEE